MEISQQFFLVEDAALQLEIADKASRQPLIQEIERAGIEVKEQTLEVPDLHIVVRRHDV